MIIDSAPTKFSEILSKTFVDININKSIQIYSGRKRRETVCSKAWKGYKSACFKSNLSSELLYKYNSWKLSVSTVTPFSRLACFLLQTPSAEPSLLPSGAAPQAPADALCSAPSPTAGPGHPWLRHTAQFQSCASYQHLSEAEGTRQHL